MNFPILTLSQILDTIRDLSIASKESIDRIKVLNLKEVGSLDPILKCLNNFDDGRIIFPPDDRQKIQLQRPMLSACLVVIPEEQIDNKICYYTILIWSDFLGNIFNKFLDRKVEYTWFSCCDFIYTNNYWSLNVPWIFWLGENEIEIRIDTITYPATTEFSNNHQP